MSESNSPDNSIKPTFGDIQEKGPKSGVSDRQGGRVDRKPYLARGADVRSTGSISRKTQQDLIESFTPKINIDELPGSEQEIVTEQIIGYISVPENQHIFGSDSNEMISINPINAVVIEESEDESGEPTWKAIKSIRSKNGQIKNIPFFLKPGKNSPLYKSLHNPKDK